MIEKFDISNEMTVVTSSYVTKERLPILEVWHEDDEEGGSLWQFHCGNDDYSMEEMELVRLDTILKIDETIQSILTLAKNKSARRKAIGMDWIITSSE